MQVYLIPGLGADKRMYQHQLNIFPEARVIEHFYPGKQATITSYAKLMAEQIDTSSPFILVGTSLGGILSVELSRILSPEKVILIASVKNRSEMPLFIRSMKYLNLHRIISGRRYKSFNTLMVKRLDNRRDSEAAEIIRAMTADVSPEFIEWAINAVVHWQPPAEYRNDIVHLHGTKDLLFPISKIKNAIPVEGGTHVMNITSSGEVNRLLLDSLKF